MEICYKIVTALAAHPEPTRYTQLIVGSGHAFLGGFLAPAASTSMVVVIRHRVAASALQIATPCNFIV